MSWVVFSYSLPSVGRSSPRVAVWRRLRSVGAIAPKGGVYVLPAREECLEAFQWLEQEVEQAGGEALLMRVERFEGFSDAQLTALFQKARRQEYEELDIKAAQLEQSLAAKRTAAPKALRRAHDTLASLRRRRDEIARIDFFECPDRGRVSARLGRIAEALSSGPPDRSPVAAVRVDAYRDKQWVTRPNPHVDRLACAWLIRRFINRDAVIRYSNTPEPHEITFDMAHARFGHHGNLCTFETMVRAFGLDAPGLRTVAEIVHEIDLRDGRYAHPETQGVDAVLKGWMALPDPERESHGVALFEGLCGALSQTAPKRPRRKIRHGRPRAASASRRPQLQPAAR